VTRARSGYPAIIFHSNEDKPGIRDRTVCHTNNFLDQLAVGDAAMLLAFELYGEAFPLSNQLLKSLWDHRRALPHGFPNISISQP